MRDCADVILYFYNMYDIQYSKYCLLTSWLTLHQEISMCLSVCVCVFIYVIVIVFKDSRPHSKTNNPLLDVPPWSL